MSAKSVQQLRDELTDTCAGTLLGYRRNCAQASAPSQVGFSEVAIATFPDSVRTACYSRSIQRASNNYSRDEQDEDSQRQVFQDSLNGI